MKMWLIKSKPYYIYIRTVKKDKTKNNVGWPILSVKGDFVENVYNWYFNFFKGVCSTHIIALKIFLYYFIFDIFKWNKIEDKSSEHF